MRNTQKERPQTLDVGERDLEVVRFIGDEGLLGFTFEGLKRSLGVHPETLSRILDRLEEQRVLEKMGHGYELTQKGRELVGIKQLTSSEPRITLLRTLLPRTENSGEVLAALRGRWFGPLRWLGYAEEEKGTSMKWITEDGGIQVDAIFGDGELTIEGRIREGKDLTDAIRASHQLVGHISRIVPASRDPRVAFFGLSSSFVMAN